MPRRNKTAENLDLEVIKAPSIDLNVLEIRGRDNKWLLFYPEAENISTPVAVYDQDGKLKEVVNSWVATNKYSPVHDEFESVEAAQEAAERIQPGCETKVITISARGENLRKRKNDDD
jgi:hypothetical protein